MRCIVDLIIFRYTKQKLIEGSDVNETMMKNRFF